MDKTDKNFRKFEYDDERMYGNPQKFKVLYEETGVQMLYLLESQLTHTIIF